MQLTKRILIYLGVVMTLGLATGFALNYSWEGNSRDLLKRVLNMYTNEESKTGLDRLDWYVRSLKESFDSIAGKTDAYKDRRDLFFNLMFWPIPACLFIWCSLLWIRREGFFKP